MKKLVGTAVGDGTDDIVYRAADESSTTKALEPTLGELEAAHRSEPQRACKHCGKPGGH